MNYGELKQEVLDIAHLTITDTVGARVAKFIRRAESLIASNVRALELMETVSILEANRVAAGSALYNVVPAASATVLDIITVSGGGNPRALTRRGVSELTTYFADNGGLVHSYATRTEGALFRLQFRATPPTDSSFAAQLWKRPADMANDADTRPLLTAYEGLYINAALHWLYIDAHQLELARGHIDLFSGEAERVNAIAKAALRSGQVAALDYQLDSGSAM